MLSQNPKLEVTSHQLKYVTCVAYWNRLMHLRRLLGYSIFEFPQLFELNQLATGILLPAAIANYIASFGKVQLPSGTFVVPSIPRHPDRDHNYIFPSAYVDQLDEQIPDNNFWCLSSVIITRWNMHISRGGKVDFGLRLIDNTITDGTLSMVVSQQPENEGTCVPVSPVEMTYAEAEAGGAYNFRNYREYSTWPGHHCEILYAQFSSPPIFVRQVVFNLCQLTSSNAAGKQ